MPIHGEFRMLAAHAQLAQEAGVPAGSIVLAENGSVVELDASGAADRRPRSRRASRSSTGSEWGTSRDVALRDRRHLSEDGVLIVVATVGATTARRTAIPS